MGDSSNYYLEQFRRALVVTKKNIKIYYSKGSVLIFGIIFPLFLFLAFFIGRNLSIVDALPGLLGMTVFFTATSVGPTIIPFEVRSRTLERLVSSPINLWTIFFGDMLSSFLFGFIISLIPLIIGVFIGISIINYALILSGVFLGTLCFSALSILLSAYPPSDTPSTIMMISSLVRFPLVFISGVFIPISALPSWGVIISSISPLTYFVDLARYAVVGVSYYPIALDLSVLIFAAILFFVVAVSIHKKTLLSRFS